MWEFGGGASEGEDTNIIEKSVADEVLVVKPLPESRPLCTFSHIFAGGYASGYYSYQWSKVFHVPSRCLVGPRMIREIGPRERVGIFFRGATERAVKMSSMAGGVTLLPSHIGNTLSHRLPRSGSGLGPSQRFDRPCLVLFRSYTNKQHPGRCFDHGSFFGQRQIPKESILRVEFVDTPAQCLAARRGTRRGPQCGRLQRLR